MSRCVGAALAASKVHWQCTYPDRLNGLLVVVMAADESGESGLASDLGFR